VKRNKLGVVVSTAAAVIVTLNLAGFASAEPVLETLYAFTGGADGSFPAAGLVQDRAGNLYGTTQFGGNRTCPAPDCGVVFKLAPNEDGTWTQSVLYAFNGPDGSQPLARLILDREGNLYGTTQSGGDFSCGLGSGCGTVFKLAETGTLTVLHTFRDADGRQPLAGLIRDPEGNLYGTTYLGGRQNSGTIFKLDKDGNQTVLYNFGPQDPAGYYPYAGLIHDAAGNLYGTTNIGSSLLGKDWGCVFKLKKDGKMDVLYSFIGGEDGAYSTAGLIRDGARNFCGTTSAGGGNGTVFKLDKDGNETVLYSFTGGADGSSPYAGLVRDPEDNLYGTTQYGGPRNRGALFKLDKDGNFTVLHTFTGGLDGGNPKGDLIIDSAGNLYGTTYVKGRFDSGTVFKLTP